MLALGRVLLSTLALGLSSSALSTKIRQQYEYRSVQVPVSQFYDNVATTDFDGSGASYPIEYLPTGQLISENIEVCSTFNRRVYIFNLIYLVVLSSKVGQRPTGQLHFGWPSRDRRPQLHPRVPYSLCRGLD